jgi:hypothetical protein
VEGVISTLDLVRLEQALRGGELFPAARYPKLRLFAQILRRIELPEGVPSCNLGDALEAITDLATSRPASWSFAPAVEPSSFLALEYAGGAAGIDREFRSHREGWLAHGEQSRRFIEGALEQVVGRQVVWVFGAGRAYDLPLQALAEQFQKVVLVDIDREALAATVAAMAPSLRPRFHPVAADLTGIAGTWSAKTLEAVRGAPDAGTAAQRLAEQFNSYAIAEERPWEFLGDAPDLIVSQLLLSQLNAPLERYPRQLYELCFGVPLLEQPGLRVANMLFAHRVQHDHVRFLQRHAPAAVLTSDVTERYTRLTAAGVPEPAGDDLHLLGAYRLAERIPRGFSVAREQEWYWHRALPRAPEEVGSRMRVDALLLHRVSSAFSPGPPPDAPRPG